MQESSSSSSLSWSGTSNHHSPDPALPSAVPGMFSKDSHPISAALSSGCHTGSASHRPQRPPRGTFSHWEGSSSAFYVDFSFVFRSLP